VSENSRPELKREQLRRLVDDWEFQNSRLGDEISRLDSWLLASALAVNLGGMASIIGSEKIDHRSMWWACFWFFIGVVSAFVYALALRFNQMRMRDYGSMRVEQLMQYYRGLIDVIPQGEPSRTRKFSGFSKAVRLLQAFPLLTFVVGGAIIGSSL
jgi:hypothetical protein